MPVTLANIFTNPLPCRLRSDFGWPGLLVARARVGLSHARRKRCSINRISGTLPVAFGAPDNEVVRGAQSAPILPQPLSLQNFPRSQVVLGNALVCATPLPSSHPLVCLSS